MKSLIIKQFGCLLALFLTANFAISQESKLWLRFDNTTRTIANTQKKTA